MEITEAKQIIPGKRVRCIYKFSDDRIGKLATIVTSPNYNNRFEVVWDDGNTEWIGWYFEPELFELIEEEKITTQACYHCGCHNKLDIQKCWYCQKEPK